MGGRLWTNIELNILRDSYHTVKTSDIAKNINRTPESIRRMARILKVNKSIKEYKWSEAEDQYLISNYKTMRYDKIAKHLNRTSQSIKSRVKYLNLDKKKDQKEWSKEEIDYLKRNSNLATKDIALHLNRNVNSVQMMKHYLGLTNNIEWTKAELDYLQNNYLLKNSQEIAIHLNRSPMAIRTKANELGLKKLKKWTDEEISTLLFLYGQMSYNDMQRYIFKNRNKEDIIVKASSLGIADYSAQTGPLNWRWKENYEPDRGKEWRRIRKQILARDNYRCRNCGITQDESKSIYGVGLHVHHIIPWRISHDNSPENLITLCPKCHAELEHMEN